MKLHQIIEQHWQTPYPILRILLSPLSRLFAHIATKRRARYLSGSLNTKRLPVPVVVVGNLHAGGTGKTPITAALVSALHTRGVKVGIISRGYGRTSRDIHVLNAHSTAADAGDEPLMLFRQTHAPTAVGADRYAAGIALLNQHPDLQIIISDDGLQHYALARDLEICVFPAADVGRDDLDVLPNGGLREPISRLQQTDFTIISHGDPETASRAQQHFRLPETPFYSQIQAAAPYRLARPTDTLSANDISANSRCVAVAAIARPQRFFNSLTQLGFTLHETQTLPDHATINTAALPHADYLFITEKDAAKLPAQVPENIWVLPIQAHITPDLAAAVCTKLFTPNT